MDGPYVWHKVVYTLALLSNSVNTFTKIQFNPLIESYLILTHSHWFNLGMYFQFGPSCKINDPQLFSQRLSHLYL